MSDLGCLMRDSIDYALLPAAVSWIDRAVARVFVEPRLRSMFAFRRQAFAARFAPIDTAMQPEELR